jgi:hypothetical protein
VEPLGPQRHLTAGADTLENRVVLGHQLFGDHRRAAAEHLPGRPAEQAFRGGIPCENGLVPVKGDDRVGSTGDDRMGSTGNGHMADATVTSGPVVPHVSIVPLQPA